MKKYSVLLSIFWSFALFAQQGGGMWIPTELNESEMKDMGMHISAKEIFNPKSASIKDAIAHFGGGCTSEVISPQGLLLTNHHCGYRQIQSHSTVEHNYLEEGYWAQDFENELPNPGLTATFIVDIKDVTAKILNGVSPDHTEQQRNDRIKDNIDIISANTVKESYQDVMVRPFYKGNKYYLFITETFKDVRLVGAPPSSIGKFGSDTDNWMWPRHTGDFSVFRIYADKNNRPAAYSKDNVPYTPKHYLPVNVGGIEEGDFTFVFGFPGMTDEYLPAAALEQLTQKLNPAKIKIRENALGIIDKYMKDDEKIKIQYASKYASVANYWKKWIGESQGLERSGAIEQRKAYEEEFMKRVKERCMVERSKECAIYPQLIPTLNNLYKEIEPYNYASDYFNEAIYRNAESFRIALTINNLIDKQNDADFPGYYKRVQGYLEGLYKNFNPSVDKEVALRLWEMYQEDMPAEFRPNDVHITEADLNNSIILNQLFTDVNQTMQNPKQFLALAQQDALAQKIGKVKDTYQTQVSNKKSSIQDQIDNQLRTYMQAQLEMMKDKKFFPDANSTLRVTYGKVKGYEPKDGVYYDYKTTLKGVQEKYKPGDYEFDVPQKLLDLYQDQDYGTYAQDGELPVNFIATNHTTGGNSGSPALDADGNLIGLNFDRVWEGTMSDYHYDPEISRNIMVDARYILFIIDKYADAQRLIKEMKLVDGKKQK
ncbi:serine protease [Flavobacteriaceae bacterium Ap0902]|nr:serine protease [Flavobacteriaceae bacterium Ap0902]